MIAKEYLAEKYHSMRVDFGGIFSRISRKINKSDRYLIDQFEKHLQETAKGFYSGNIKIVDKFFQLYCLDDNRPQEPRKEE